MGNPTRGGLEIALAQVENAKHSAVFSSGMSAIAAVIQTLESGDHVLAMNDLYGGTTSYFSNIVSKSNKIDISFEDLSQIEQVEKLIKPSTKIIWLESLTNPLLKTTDIKMISQIAKKHGCLLVIDSTFTNPSIFNALDFGADIVVHSATKYIGGHSDIIMGVICCNSDELIKKIRQIQIGIGAIPSPFDCYLALRGLKTLHLRTKESEANSLKIAQFLESNSLVEKVIYPGLKTHSQHELIKSQFRGFGSVVSCYLKADSNQVNKFLTSLKIFKLAVSLGAVESLICAPALMTHASVPQSTRESVGVTNNLIRISVGIEDSEDLIGDLSQALNKAQL
jgi:cystathionine gamma-lyase